MRSFWRHFAFLSLPCFLLDVATKEWILRKFAPPTPEFTDGVPVIPGFFDLVRLHNTGVAFGMANNAAGSNWIFGGIGLGALLLVIYLWKRNTFPTAAGRCAAALLVSGVLGNLLDRIRHGYVVDFLLFNLGFMVWPAFNVADSCICIAAGLLFISAFQKEPAAAGSAKASAKVEK
jgi:signal peptidase II